jgi:hypothetical protein
MLLAKRDDDFRERSSLDPDVDVHVSLGVAERHCSRPDVMNLDVPHHSGKVLLEPGNDLVGEFRHLAYIAQFDRSSFHGAIRA